MSKGNKYQIILGSDGGILLKLGSTFAHFYAYPEDAAEDLARYIQGGEESQGSWNGNYAKWRDTAPSA